jgi:hypothetical protein
VRRRSGTSPRQAPLSNLPGMDWQLDPRDVSESWSGRSSAPAGGFRPTRRSGPPVRQESRLTLAHTPTGVTVTAAATGPFTRAQQKAAHAELRQQLFERLEAEVAKKLHVGGR